MHRTDGTFDAQGTLVLASRRARWAGIQAIAAFVVVGICTATLALTGAGVLASTLRKDAAGTRDFVAYWASGQLLRQHTNPYDRAAIYQSELSAGYSRVHQPLMMRNPPTALPLVLPLGYANARPGVMLWWLLLLGALVVSVRMVWEMHGRPKTLVNLLGYFFGPAMICLTAEQMSLFLLLGLVLFLRFQNSRPFVAGLALWLCMLKPHLFLPFGIAVLAWAVFTKSYKVLAGAALALAASAAVATVLDPQVWMHYREMLTSDRVDAPVIPCLSIELRRMIAPQAAWLQYLPVVLGCAWALVYLRRHRHHWSWLEHGSVLMLVSYVVAPYAWVTDQVVLIPALLHGAYLTRSRSMLGLLALASAAIELILLRGVEPFHSAVYLWTGPGWLVWYLYAIRRKSRPGVPEDAPFDLEQGIYTRV